MPHPIDVQVGSMVRTTRVSQSKSQSDLANALGISFQQIQKYEQGSNRISISRLWEIAQYLKVDPSHFLSQLSEKNAEATQKVPNKTLKVAAKLEEIQDPAMKDRILNLIQACCETTSLKEAY